MTYCNKDRIHFMNIIFKKFSLFFWMNVQNTLDEAIINHELSPENFILSYFYLWISLLLLFNLLLFHTTVFFNYYINLHNVMIWSALWWKNLIRTRQKLIYWIWGCQYIIDSCPILACPLHNCNFVKKKNHLKNNKTNLHIKSKKKICLNLVL